MIYSIVRMNSVFFSDEILNKIPCRIILQISLKDLRNFILYVLLTKKLKKKLEKNTECFVE